MISKVCARGRRVEGLLYYLFTEGVVGEKDLRSAHADPRVVAGWDDPAVLQPERGPEGRWDFRALAGLLTQPLLVAGVGRESSPVYHLVAAAAKDPATGRMTDRVLTDAQWRDVAEEYLDRLGFAPRGDEMGARWVAVRHADDHIHIVVTLARQDGRRLHPRNDFYRAREASHTVEARYGLTSTAAAQHSDAGETAPRRGGPPGRRPSSSPPRRAGPGRAPGRRGPRTGSCCAGRSAPPRLARRAWPSSSTGCTPEGCSCGNGAANATPTRSPATPWRSRPVREPAGVLRRRQARRRPHPAQAAAPLRRAARRPVGHGAGQKRIPARDSGGRRAAVRPA